MSYYDINDHYTPAAQPTPPIVPQYYIEALAAALHEHEEFCHQSKTVLSIVGDGNAYNGTDDASAHPTSGRKHARTIIMHALNEIKDGIELCSQSTGVTEDYKVVTWINPQLDIYGTEDEDFQTIQDVYDYYEAGDVTECDSTNLHKWNQLIEAEIRILDKLRKIYIADDPLDPSSWKATVKYFELADGDAPGISGETQTGYVGVTGSLPGWFDFGGELLAYGYPIPEDYRWTPFQNLGPGSYQGVQRFDAVVKLPRGWSSGATARIDILCDGGGEIIGAMHDGDDVTGPTGGWSKWVSAGLVTESEYNAFASGLSENEGTSHISMSGGAPDEISYEGNTFTLPSGDYVYIGIAGEANMSNAAGWLAAADLIEDGAGVNFRTTLLVLLQILSKAIVYSVKIICIGNTPCHKKT